jgi:hypothetical protein
MAGARVGEDCTSMTHRKWYTKTCLSTFHFRWCGKGSFLQADREQIVSRGVAGSCRHCHDRLSLIKFQRGSLGFDAMERKGSVD